MNGLEPELTEPDVHPRASPNGSRRNVSNCSPAR